MDPTGELFELATGGMFRATTHRVRMPTFNPRLSVNFFCGPRLAHVQDTPLRIPPQTRAIPWPKNGR